jgi:hypothetical protein
MNNVQHAGPISERMREFLLERVALAESLHSNQVATFYDEAILLCSVLSACAAMRWPGSDIGRKRFVELLVMHSPPYMACTWVSVPMLVSQGLLDPSLAQLPNPTKDNSWRDVDVDGELDTIVKQHPTLSIDAAKSCSYASLVYAWHRGGYSNEWSADSLITCVPGSRKRARVHYIQRNIAARSEWLVGLSITYLYELAKHHAVHVAEKPYERPATWWLS